MMIAGRLKGLTKNIPVIPNPLLNSNHVFPYHQGEFTIFDKGNFLYHAPDSNNLVLNVKPLVPFIIKVMPIVYE